MDYGIREKGRAEIIARNERLFYESYDENDNQTSSGELCVLHHSGYSNALGLFCFIQETVQKNIKITFRNSCQGVEDKVK